MVAIAMLAISKVRASGGVFGSSDPSVNIYPIDCYTCREKYGYMDFCNVNNEYGVCCPQRSNDDHNCKADAHHNIKCTDKEQNVDLWWSYCIETHSKQCGKAKIYDFEDEEDHYEIDVTGLRRAAGQACIWTFLSPNLDKESYFQMETLFDFDNITNMEVMIASGYTRQQAYTSYPSISTGDLISMPIYNTTYVIAKPKANATNTRIAFHVKIYREIEVFQEKLEVRKIVTGTITAGGVFIFVTVMAILCLVRRYSKLKKSNSRSKINAEPISSTHRHLDNTVMGKLDHENSQIDFEELNRTIESPKTGKNKGVEQLYDEKLSLKTKHHK